MKLSVSRLFASAGLGKQRSSPSPGFVVVMIGDGLQEGVMVEDHGVPAPASKADSIYCSFCGKSNNEVRRIIAGPAVFICDGCIDLCGYIMREETRPQGAERSVPCPSCSERISLIAAVGRNQRWGISLRPGPSGLLQAATIAGTIDGAQKMMRATTLEDGAKVQTYVEAISTKDDGTIDISFITLAVSKVWAEANKRADAAAGIETRSATTAGRGPKDESPGPKGAAEKEPGQ